MIYVASSSPSTCAYQRLQTATLSMAEADLPAPAPRRPRILLGLTGSVAAVKWTELVLALSRVADVRWW